MINEVTYPPRSKENNDTNRSSRSLDQAMVISGDKVVGFNGSGTTECPDLDPLGNYVSFMGNGVRRGWATNLDVDEESRLPGRRVCGFSTIWLT